MAWWAIHRSQRPQKTVYWNLMEEASCLVVVGDHRFTASRLWIHGRFRVDLWVEGPMEYEITF